MARNGKGGPGGLIAGAALLVLLAIAAAPPVVWVVTVLALIGYLFYRYSKSNAAGRLPQTPTPKIVPTGALFRQSTSEHTPSSGNGHPNTTAVQGASEPVRISPPTTAREREFKIPAAPRNHTTRWVPEGESVEVAGLTIPGGMLYIGSTLRAGHGGTDPCLINPSLPVAGHGDYKNREMGYWPSYSEISPSARRAYLRWLEGGRKDPDADVGYVFLFFYGLERRVILDFATSPESKDDWPGIAREIRRLLTIYQAVEKVDLRSKGRDFGGALPLVHN